MRRQVYTDNFLRGLQDTQDATGLPYPGFQYFGNVRVDDGVLKRRLGRLLVDTAAPSRVSQEFDGGTMYGVVPASEWHTYGIPFTVETVFSPIGLTGTQPIVGWNHASAFPFSIYLETDSSGTTLKATYRTSATATVSSSASIAVNDDVAVQWIRASDDTLTLNVYNATDDVWTSDTSDASGTLGGAVLQDPAVDMYAARDTGSNFFHGDIDYIRLFNIARTRKDDLMLRWPDPLCAYCVGCWEMDAYSGKIVPDLSRYGNTMSLKNTPTSATKITHDTLPVQGIFPYTTRDGVRRLVTVVDGVVYDSELP